MLLYYFGLYKERNCLQTHIKNLYSPTISLEIHFTVMKMKISVCSAFKIIHKNESELHSICWITHHKCLIYFWTAEEGDRSVHNCPGAVQLFPVNLSNSYWTEQNKLKILIIENLFWFSEIIYSEEFRTWHKPGDN